MGTLENMAAGALIYGFLALLACEMLSRLGLPSAFVAIPAGAAMVAFIGGGLGLGLLLAYG